MVPKGMALLLKSDHHDGVGRAVQEVLVAVHGLAWPWRRGLRSVRISGLCDALLLPLYEERCEITAHVCTWSWRRAGCDRTPGCSREPRPSFLRARVVGSAVTPLLARPGYNQIKV